MSGEERGSTGVATCTIPKGVLKSVGIYSVSASYSSSTRFAATASLAEVVKP
jgi:hypothetical protein